MGFSLRALPMVAVPHAGGPVEQDHDLARAGRRGGGLHRVFLEKRPREGQRDERHRGDPQQQQKPVLDAAALDGLVRNLPQEHERRKQDDVAPLALNEVHEDRHGDRAQSDDEERREE